jgi:hypothetical protein
MMDKVELTVIVDKGGLGFLMRTQNGEAVFGPLELAATYTSQRGLKNAVSRIKGEFDVQFLKATLEVHRGFYD